MLDDTRLMKRKTPPRDVLTSRHVLDSKCQVASVWSTNILELGAVDLCIPDSDHFLGSELVGFSACISKTFLRDQEFFVVIGGPSTSTLTPAVEPVNLE